MAHPAITRTIPDPANKARDAMWAGAGQQRLAALARAEERARAEHAAAKAHAEDAHATVHAEARAEFAIELRESLAGADVRIDALSGRPMIVAGDADVRVARIQAAFEDCYRRLTAADVVLADRVNSAAADLVDRLDAVNRARLAVPQSCLREVQS